MALLYNMNSIDLLICMNYKSSHFNTYIGQRPLRSLYFPECLTLLFYYQPSYTKNLTYKVTILINTDFPHRDLIRL